MAKAPTQIRIDAELKKEATELFDELGLDLSGAQNVAIVPPNCRRQRRPASHVAGCATEPTSPAAILRRYFHI
ncbi:MAG: hypothetical protein PUJ57_00360 [Peptoniphilaceae bacterium]|nr:hypothetical protein [Peptoniphilaceae bacterium]MDY6086277.1 hypothetical protein [Peptoniphilaceae bacterium]